MTDRELMQMALDALEAALSNDQPYISRSEETAEALRARLAQSEQDDGYCQACDGDSCTAKEGCVARDNPPPQREWQGLVIDEIEASASLGVYAKPLIEFASAIEAKLKEKNIG